MGTNSNFIALKEKIYHCIETNFNLNVRDVPILYLDPIEFLRCIKSNVNLSLEYYEDIERLKEFYLELCKRVPGLYKWREKKVYIKEEEKNDLSLLITELLHAKSITQDKRYIEDWIKEGLPHYLAKVLCKNCDIQYSESSHQQYFSIWEKIHKRYSINILITIIYAKDIRISKGILKNIFNYEKDDILEISFGKAKELIKLI